mmetsp:Transcript_53093/g.149061  ORF Transcript_53093/g.149061 Transcript_53093/m.149061 type:complete len:237 (+) Transcript_53093:101-811(+)
MPICERDTPKHADKGCTAESTHARPTRRRGFAQQAIPPSRGSGRLTPASCKGAGASPALTRTVMITNLCVACDVQQGKVERQHIIQIIGLEAMADSKPPSPSKREARPLKRQHRDEFQRLVDSGLGIRRSSHGHTAGGMLPSPKAPLLTRKLSAPAQLRRLKRQHRRPRTRQGRCLGKPRPPAPMPPHGPALAKTCHRRRPCPAMPKLQSRRARDPRSGRRSSARRAVCAWTPLRT